MDPWAELAAGALRDGRTPRGLLGSSLPDHDEIPIPDRYIPQANASEAEPQEQAMGNDLVETREIFSRYTVGKF